MTPNQALRHHVTGAIERGEKQAIAAIDNDPCGTATSMAADGIRGTLQAIAQVLMVDDVAAWEGFAITRVPHNVYMQRRMRITWPNGDEQFVTYESPIGRPLPFDRQDTERMLAVYGARLAR